MSLVLATPVASLPSKKTSTMMRERSKALRSSAGSKPGSLSSATRYSPPWGLDQARHDCTRFQLFFADDVRRNHPATRGNIREFRIRQTSESRPNLAVKEQRINVD